MNNAALKALVITSTDWQAVEAALIKSADRLGDALRPHVLYVIREAAQNVRDSHRELLADVEAGVKSSMAFAQVAVFTGGAGTLAVDSRIEAVVRWFAVRGIRG